MVRERGERPENPVPPAPPKPVFEPPINWWKLDAEERTETLEVLFDWVRELVRRYGLRDSEVPPCWYRHEAMVQELLALFQYRNQQQFLESAPPGAPIDFHYQLQLALGRLRSWTGVTGCNGAEHLATPIQQWADTANPKSQEWEAKAFMYLQELEAAGSDLDEGNE